MIASLKVAAHRRGSASFDRAHRPALPEMQTVSRPIGRAIAPEDIADLDPPRRAWRDAHPLAVELIDELER